MTVSMPVGVERHFSRRERKRLVEEGREAILAELTDVQGERVELGGYYLVDRDKATAVMRPSATFNAALEGF